MSAQPLAQTLEISIHALREEGDACCVDGDIDRQSISIHALREEGDQGCVYPGVGILPISIHALREEGDVKPVTAKARAEAFLSTPSARRATSFFRKLLWI